jgi:hypothetical protein
LQLLQSLSLLGLGIYLIAASEGIPDRAVRATHLLPLAIFDNMISSAVMIVLGLLGGVTAFALLRLRSWAWMAAIILQGFGLLAALIGYIRQQPNYVGMVTSIILVLYLNQQEVQAAFREKRDGEHYETL